jgi:hypothetical protein
MHPEARPQRMPPSCRDDDRSGAGRHIPAAWRDEQPRTVIVDGETFLVSPRPTAPGTYDFDWTSGPNDGYGFALSGGWGQVRSPEDIREDVRNFLDQIDPDTGYLADTVDDA